ncbi:hypothetical protein LQ318_12550 [Aliifodinibius salicampi]|uniref:DUF4270 family protein n=1 Tax=Fodinibius salicampi TaxID=1920655 RepID=A0ABT3Q0V0_9BACT|nr:hypothetical protein [Fodinibius salicampi]MCW9713734.1 hypothetical protein [Fodinibius salicampi]
MFQSKIGNFLDYTGSLTILLVLIAFGIITGCENPGSVGSNLSESGAEVEVVDIPVEGVETISFNSYSGNFTYFSAGAYNDPIFGEIAATGLLKPSLPVSNDDSLQENAIMKMRLLFDWEHVYGDTLAEQTFDVYPIQEFWRGNAFKLKEEIQIDENTKVASFTVEEEDSLDVILNSDWVDNNYRPYIDAENADSLYENEVFGLALVPTGGGKILPLNSSSTRFVIENPESDTFEVSNNRWAYHLDRNNEGETPDGVVKAYNMLENTLTFDLDLSGIEISGPNISKAELVFYRDVSMPDPGPQVKRQDVQRANLHFVDPKDAPDNLVPGNPVVNGTYSEKDQAYHFDVTSLLQSGLIDGLPEEQQFYITLPMNGSVKTDLIYSSTSDINPPKLEITYLKNSSN